MFGTFRFLLAITIMLGHMIGRDYFPFNIEAAALIGFYILAGYVTTSTLIEKYDSDITNIFRFYRDRMLRIYPTYIFSVLLVIVFFAIFIPSSLTLNVTRLSLNLSLLPLNFYIFIDREYLDIVASHFAVPTAPSLALIVEFYIIFPLLLLFLPKHLWAIIITSLLVFTMAATGHIDTYIYGYLLLPGTLYIFLIGMLLYFIRTKSDKASDSMLMLTLIYITLISVVVFGYFFAPETIMRIHTLEVIFGTIIFSPVIYALSFADRKKPLDIFLGNLSYPVFLLQWLAFWIVQRFASNINFMVSSIIMCILLATATSLSFDKMVQKYRRHLS